MKGSGGKFLLLWFLVVPLVFFLEIRAPLGEPWTSPFGQLAWLRKALPRAIEFHRGREFRIAAPGTTVALFLGAVWFFLGASRLGICVFRLLGLRSDDGLELLLAVPGGLLLIASVVHGAGLCGLAYPAVAWAGFAAVWVAGCGVCAEGCRRPRLLTRVGGWPMAGLAVALLLVAVPAASPERNPDALIYHLPVPAWYAEEHKVIARPDWIFAGYAQNQELLGLPGMLVFGDERWSKMMSLAAVLLAGLLVACRLGSRRAGVLIFLTTPVLAEVACTAKNDALFAASVLAAFLTLERGLERMSMPWIAAAGFLAGSACGVKNLGPPAFAALAAVIACDPRARRRPLAWISLAVPAVPGVLPYVVRNWLDLGSPAYPFLLGLFVPVGWARGNLETLRMAFGARTFTVQGPVQIIASPLHALAHLSPYLLAFVPVTVFGSALRAELRRPLAFAAVYFVIWAAGPAAGVVRFLLPIVPPLLFAASAAADQVSSRRGPTSRLATTVLAAFALIVQTAAVIAGPAWAPAPLAYALGRESLAEFRGRVSPVYASAIGRLEKDAAADASSSRAAVIGQGVQYPRPRGARLLGREIEGPPFVWSLARESLDAGHLARKFRQRRIGWVLYNLPAANFWGKYAARYPWTPRDVAVYREFWLERAVLVAHSKKASGEEGFLLLYRLNARPRAQGEKTSAFLPGTEGVFSGLREKFYAEVPLPGLLSLLEPYRGAFAGIGSYNARMAHVCLGRGEARGAAREIVALSSFCTPADRRIFGIFGSASAPASAPLAGWLKRAFPASRVCSDDHPAMLFNLGCPLAVLPPGSGSRVRVVY